MATPEEHAGTDAEKHCLNLTVGEHEYSLTWSNTLVRKFLVGDGDYDHILHEASDDEVFYLFFNGETGADIRDFLEEHDYPYRVDPVLDDVTIDLYTESQAMRLEEEIKTELS